MLVLSRKTDDAVVFPGLGITINLLKVDSRVARLGIEAPPHIRIMRKELLDGSVEESFDIQSFENLFGSSRDQLHEMRNQLNTLNLGLHLYRQQMDAGFIEEANETFQGVIKRLATIEKKVASQAETAQRVANHVGKIHVLLVEDDADQRELLAGILRMKGCNVTTAATGNEAIEYLENNVSPDYVLLDMRMPDRDGASIVQELRKCEATAGLKILATSGTSPAELGVSVGSDIGVNHWFPKPINADGLLEYMRECDSTFLSTTA